jgi:hypothetical protein
VFEGKSRGGASHGGGGLKAWARTISRILSWAVSLSVNFGPCLLAGS